MYVVKGSFVPSSEGDLSLSVLLADSVRCNDMLLYFGPCGALSEVEGH